MMLNRPGERFDRFEFSFELSGGALSSSSVSDFVFRRNGVLQTVNADGSGGGGPGIAAGIYSISGNMVSFYLHSLLGLELSALNDRLIGDSVFLRSRLINPDPADHPNSIWQLALCDSVEFGSAGAYPVIYYHRPGAFNGAVVPFPSDIKVCLGFSLRE